MYEIVLYKDKNNKYEIEEYFIKLQNKKDKDSRIKINKIIAYINMLSKLNIFTKNTQKTPRTEIEKAKRNLKDFMKRSRNDGE